MSSKNNEIGILAEEISQLSQDYNFYEWSDNFSSQEEAVTHIEEMLTAASGVRSLEKFCRDILSNENEDKEVKPKAQELLEHLKDYGNSIKYEHTARQMAEKLMEFIRDFSDDEEEIKEETDYVTELFVKLQKSEEFEVLAHHLDLMFMKSVFESDK